MIEWTAERLNRVLAENDSYVLYNNEIEMRPVGFGVKVADGTEIAELEAAYKDCKVFGAPPLVQIVRDYLLNRYEIYPPKNWLHLDGGELRVGQHRAACQ